MEYRALGRSGLQVSPITFGCNVFGWTIDEATSHRLLDAWVDAGMNFIDTADMYSTWVPGHVGGESETIIGRWFAQGGGRRDKVVLATKVGKPMGEGKVGLHPRYIREAVDASLKRLQTDRIDLYQSHDDDAKVPQEDVMGAFDDLVKAGKVRAVGASNYEAPRLASALDTSERLGLVRYESLQPLFNLHDRAFFEKELQKLCVERGVGVINFYALAAGFLTGKYRSAADAGKSPRGAGVVQKYLDARGQRILAALDTVAARVAAKPGQVALAWQIAQPGISAPIASATTLEQLKELLVAAALKLDRQSLDELSAASAY
ncbi:aldo/keto reductase [Xylophilus rhododendri]|uniref:Aldo/keto reductase n=1 Tax=Xylophilus rhododendri TaxID=2697032 RepID=A0A857J316_9BURK|nr:aldo/keto reductase [Xylophilus rhododendri]QHI97278.1 aldo/keto reductase [Xylophilus rhododendri]